MPSMLRLIKTFSVTVRRYYKNGQPPRTERPSPGIDEKVNEWVKETGNIVISATPARHTLMEKEPDGTIIRKTIQMTTIIYQGESDFLEAEGEMRRRAIVPTPKRDDEAKPVPMSDEDEHRQCIGAGMDSDAGGPEGAGDLLPADDEEDEY